MLISGRDSLMWVRKDLIRAGGGRQSGDSSQRLTRNSSTCSKNQSCSYIDIQGNLFDVPCIEDFNAATYFYLNRYDAISMEHMPQKLQLIEQRNCCNQSPAQMEITFNSHILPQLDQESESDQSDRDSHCNFKY
jgi:hypothetical protein